MYIYVIHCTIELYVFLVRIKILLLFKDSGKTLYFLENTYCADLTDVHNSNIVSLNIWNNCAILAQEYCFFTCHTRVYFYGKIPAQTKPRFKYMQN